MKRDFTFTELKEFLKELMKAHYEIITFKNFILKEHKMEKIIILRHDVDKKPMNSIKTAELENEIGISGTYYFRIRQGKFQKEIIRKILAMDHEIGYHYEDLDVADGDVNKALDLFKKNLFRLRRIVPVCTIAMHGSPLSRWDNRKLWEKYDYRDFGIIGEPYFDINFDEVLYLTDTGRRWDGGRFNVRDKAQGKGQEARGKIELKHPNTQNFTLKTEHSFHSTFDIIRAAEEGRLPDKMMINIHPQRWNDKFSPWLWELVNQNAKNAIKKLFVMRNERRKKR